MACVRRWWLSLLIWAFLAGASGVGPWECLNRILLGFCFPLFCVCLFVVFFVDSPGAVLAVKTLQVHPCAGTSICRCSPFIRRPRAAGTAILTFGVILKTLQVFAPDTYRNGHSTRWQCYWHLHSQAVAPGCETRGGDRGTQFRGHLVKPWRGAFASAVLRFGVFL